MSTRVIFTHIVILAIRSWRTIWWRTRVVVLPLTDSIPQHHRSAVPVGVADDLLSGCVGTRPRSMGRSRYPRLPFSPLGRVIDRIGQISRQIDRSAGVVSQNDAPCDVLCSGFRFILIGRPAQRYRGRKSRADTTREHACPWAYTRLATHRTARRHWRNHLSMSAPRADIPRRKWSLAGSIDDRRSARSAVYRRFYARVHALIESSRPRFTTPRVFRLLLDLAAVARKVFHLIVIFLFIHLDEELSKRAQQLVMFIAGKRAARSATSSRFSRDSCTSPWKPRNISLLPASCFLFLYFLQHYA